MKNEKVELQSILKYLNENVYSSPSGSSFNDLFDELLLKRIITYKGQLERSINHLLKDGYLIKESDNWYNITTDGILFFNNGGYILDNKQKFKKWCKNGKNIPWIITLATTIILAILAILFK